MPHILIAPDSFKGSVAAVAAAEAIAAGWRTVRAGDDVRLIPMADGGEGTIAAFSLAVPGASAMPVSVHGPDGSMVESAWLRLPPTPRHPQGVGVVELAATSGIELLERPAPFDAHTLGFGEAIAAALDAGVDRLLLGIGSSASTDGGSGALVGLGVRVLDAHDLPVPLGNRGLAGARRIDVSALRPIPSGGAVILGDVTNPLLGPTGAAAAFGAQKGAGAEDIVVLEANLGHWSALLASAGMPVRAAPDAGGAGAAGGTGFGLLAWGAAMQAGAGAIGDALGLPAAIAAADLVITGEGRFDDQSLAGKVPGHVLEVAATTATPTALVAGSIAADPAGFVQALALEDLAGSRSAALGDPLRWLHEAGSRLAATL
ncbi:glycerate kinase [Rathayibacter sp. YIM 133350]|uniref:glycerate kinase n=1 Tax=Rathayibacter sp. YIM 133350 TaxID=3131992 RepID=UPI00307F5ABB